MTTSLDPLSAPGVYYERLDASSPAIAAVRLDVAGFVGIAESGPLDVPVPVQSWRQFEARFGGFAGGGFLPYAVRAYFENGGRRCWVVRVASRDPVGGATEARVIARLARAGTPGDAGWRIRASTPGSWGEELAVSLRAVRTAEVRSIPAGSTNETAAVPGTSGFARFTLARISQAGAADAFRVVSGIDADRGLIHWVHPDPGARTHYDRPLAGFDLDQPLYIESVEHTLLVFRRRRLVRSYTRLSSIAGHARHAPLLLGAQEIPHPSDLSGEVPLVPEPIVIEALDAASLPAVTSIDLTLADIDVALHPLEGGADGLAILRPEDYMADARGFRALDLVDEVAAIAIPDLHVRSAPIPPTILPPRVVDPCHPETAQLVSPRIVIRRESPPEFSTDEVVRVQSALVEHCELRTDRIALLDAPADAALAADQGSAALRTWRQRFASSYAAAYWPWIAVVDPLRRELVRSIPPSGHVAGQIAQTDFDVGVHRAPANAALAWTQDVSLPADAVLHGLLNAEGVNVLRALPGRGVRILGAHTLDMEGELRWLNVRRLLILARKSIYRATQWAAFEPNNTLTRAKIHLALTGFLLALWQQGALAGESASEAFVVRCDEVLNPQSERDNGRLLAEVRLAPSRPMEWIVVRVGRTENEFEVAEALSIPRGSSWPF